MISLKQIREASGGKEAYQKFFNSLLKKFGVSSPSELSGDKKKKFYDALDAGWDGDNEKPEKNERHSDPENLDPETTVDGDEDQADKAASHVTEALSKLIAKAGRGKLSPRDAIDIDYMGDRKDIKFDSTKWKINIKGSGNGQALVSGEKKKIIAWLTSDDYGMDDEDIEDLFPELLESRFPKALSVIRNIGEAVKKAYPVMDQGQRDKIIKIAKANSGNMAKAIKLIDKIKKGLSDNPDVMDLLKKANEDVNEGNRFSVKLKGDAKSLWQRVTVYKQSGKAKNTHGDKEWDAVVDKMAAQHRDDNHARISPKDIAAVKLAVKHESVTEAVAVDRRTVGFKAALVRNEKAKKVREKAKKKKEAKKDQAELDARYDYDGEVDTVLAAANAVMNNTKLETAANAVAHGGVDMAPNAGKKDKEKLMARRGY